VTAYELPNSILETAASSRRKAQTGSAVARPQTRNFLTRLFDRAADAERLYGLRLEGVWMHVGTPEAIAEAERAMAASAA
jgi:NDP-sugar pyrophosphorylase family protein